MSDPSVPNTPESEPAPGGSAGFPPPPAPGGPHAGAATPPPPGAGPGNPPPGDAGWGGAGPADPNAGPADPNAGPADPNAGPPHPGQPNAGPPHPGQPNAGQPGPGWPAPAWAPSAPPTRRRKLVPAAIAVLAAGAMAGGVGVGHALWSGSGTPAATPSTELPGTGGSNGSANGSDGVGTTNMSAVAAKVAPALVDINVQFANGEGGGGAGTGIVLTSNGEVVTNNHVIEGATTISVTDVGNGKTYGATVVGYDTTDDVAVMQLTNASGLTTAKTGDSGSVTTGQAVVALGNAGGTGGTPTAAGGSVTGLDQSISAANSLTGTDENLTGLIETNADIQEGDSGGALANSSGAVIGMNIAAAAGPSSGYPGYSMGANQGYAVPINKVLSIAQTITSGHGTSTVHVGPTAALGVYVAPSSSSNSSNSSGSFGSSNQGTNPGGSGSGQSTNGAAVSGVVPGGAAARAGLSQGDVITSVGGHSVTSSSDLSRIMTTYHPGDKVQIGWTDSSGQPHRATVTLGTGPAQ